MKSLQLIANEVEIAKRLLNGDDCGLSQGKQLFILAKYYLNILEDNHCDNGKNVPLKEVVKKKIEIRKK